MQISALKQQKEKQEGTLVMWPLCNVIGILLKPNFHSGTLQASPSHLGKKKKIPKYEGNLQSIEGAVLNQLIFVLII